MALINKDNEDLNGKSCCEFDCNDNYGEYHLGIYRADVVVVGEGDGVGGGVVVGDGGPVHQVEIGDNGAEFEPTW